MKYRKKPVVVEAWLNTDDGEPIPAWVSEASSTLEGGRFAIKTLEGTMIAEPGDWIVRGIQGEVYPVKPNIFEATYDPVDPANKTTNFNPKFDLATAYPGVPIGRMDPEKVLRQGQEVVAKAMSEEWTL